MSGRTRLAARTGVLSLLVPLALAAPTVSRATPGPRPVSPHLHTLALSGVDAASVALAAAGRASTAPLLALGPVRATPRFSLVAVTWAQQQQTAGVSVSVRVRTAGRWSGWYPLGGQNDTGADPNSVDVRGHVVRDGTSPLWVGPSDGVQARVERGAGPAPRDLRIDLIDPGTSPADNPAARATPPASRAAAATSMPTIITRAQWGADESIRVGSPSYSPTVKIGFVHHTATTNSYTPSDSAALVRGIYAYHVLSNGWSDIGYNFLVDRYGQVFEGRYGGVDQAVIGAHTGGFNYDSFAASLIGDYTTTTPTGPQLASLDHLFAWKLGRYYRNPYGTDTLVSAGGGTDRWPVGAVVRFNVIAGHRDAGYTTCPGDAAYAQLPAIRAGVLTDTGAGLVAPYLRQDTAGYHIGAGLLRPSSWSVTVTNAVTGAVVRVYKGAATASVDVVWPLVDAGGTPVGSGAYTLRLDATANATTAVPFAATTPVLGADPAPAAVSPGGTLALYHRSAAGGLDVQTATPGGWSTPASLGGALVGGPAAVASGSVSTVFVRGTTNGLYQRVLSGASWSGWRGLGGAITARPAAVDLGGGRTGIFVRAGDGALYTRTASTAGWSGWASLGGSVAFGSGPAAVGLGSGRAAVIVQGADGGAWQRTVTGTVASGWTPLSGRFVGDVGAAPGGSTGGYHVFVRGTDNALWDRYFDGRSWAPWRSLGGRITSGASAVAGSNRLDIFAVGGNGALYQLTWAAGAWAAWRPVG